MFVELADLPVLVAPEAGLDFPSPYEIYDGPRVGDEFEETPDNRPTGLPPGPPLSRVDQYGFGFYGAGGRNAKIAQGNGLGQLPPAANQGIQSFAAQAVKGITFKSTLTGAVTIQQPLGPGQPATATVEGGSPFSKFMMEFSQPAIYVETPVGVIPFEPYGTPTQDYSTLLVVGSVAAIAVLGIGAIWAVRRIGR